MYDDEPIRIKELDLNTISPWAVNCESSSRIVIVGAPGSGKCLSFDTDILMYRGNIEKVQNIRVGDLIMGDDSTPRRVLSLTRGREEMYEIKHYKHGQTYTVNKSHILSLKTRRNPSIRDELSRNRYRVKWTDLTAGRMVSKNFTYRTQGDMKRKEDVYKTALEFFETISKDRTIDISVEHFLKLGKSAQENLQGYMTGVEFESQPLDFDPYVIGLWLGDGTSSNSTITNQDSTVINYLQTNLHNYACFINFRSRYTYNIKGYVRGKNPFLISLQSNKLINNKHIPSVYKLNSRSNRLKLLAGLIDSDGNINKDGLYYEITQKNATLARDIVFLCQSLGFSMSSTLCKKGCWYKGEYKEGTYTRMNIWGNHLHEIPVLCPRKKIAVRRTCIRDPMVTAISVTPKGVGDYYGFELDGNHRYVLGNFVVTHNSTLIKSLMYNKHKIIPVCEIFSGSEAMKPFFQHFVPSIFIHNGLNPDKIVDFKKRQGIAKQHLQNPWAILLLDDVSDDPKLLNTPLFGDLFKMGRHWSFFFILSLQYGLDIRPSLRSCVDFCFIFRDSNLRNRKKLYENFAGIVPDFSTFCDLMDSITGDYTALVIRNNIQTNNWTDCVFWFKANPTPPGWKFGHPDYWEFSKARYNLNYTERF